MHGSPLGQLPQLSLAPVHGSVAVLQLKPSIAQLAGHEAQKWPFEVSLAMVAAMRGDRAAVDSLTEAMTAWAPSTSAMARASRPGQRGHGAGEARAGAGPRPAVEAAP